MNAPKLDPRFVSEIAWQKNRAIANNVRWVRRFRACSIASVVLGVGAWFLCFPEPTDRDWGTACGMVVSAWLVGICLLSLFGSKGSDPKCPQCGTAWVEEEQIWPTWKHCPGCGLKMEDEVG